MLAAEKLIRVKGSNKTFMLVYDRNEFVFGGVGVQQSRLEAEGVVVKDGRADLEKYAMPDIK